MLCDPRVMKISSSWRSKAPVPGGVNTKHVGSEGKSENIYSKRYNSLSLTVCDLVLETLTHFSQETVPTYQSYIVHGHGTEWERQRHRAPYNKPLRHQNDLEAETEAHLTPGGLSSWAGDTGLGAQRHHTSHTLYTYGKQIQIDTVGGTDWYVCMSAARQLRHKHCLSAEYGFPSIRASLTPEAGYKSWPLSTGCSSYCCRMRAIDGYRGPEVALLPPTDESHICKCAHTPFFLMRLCSHVPLLLFSRDGLIDFFHSLPPNCVSERPHTPDLSLR